MTDYQIGKIAAKNLAKETGVKHIARKNSKTTIGIYADSRNTGEYGWVGCVSNDGIQGSRQVKEAINLASCQ